MTNDNRLTYFPFWWGIFKENEVDYREVINNLQKERSKTG